MLRKSISELREDIGELVNQVCYGGERAVIHRRNKDCVAIVPIADLRLLEHLETLIDIRDAEEALKEGKARPFRELLQELEDGKGV